MDVTNRSDDTAAQLDTELVLLSRVDEAYALARREVFDKGLIETPTAHQIQILDGLEAAERELQRFREQRRSTVRNSRSDPAQA